MFFRFIVLFVIIFHANTHAASPIINISEPSSLSEIAVGTELVSKWSIFDASSVDFTSISLYQNGSLLKKLHQYTSPSNGGYIYRWTVDVSTGSNYHLRFFARHENGEFAEKDTPVFKVISAQTSTTKPQITILEPESKPNNVELGNKISLKWRVSSEDTIVFNAVSLYQNGKELEVLASNKHGGLTTTTWTVKQPSGNGYHFRFFAASESGSFSQVDSQTFSIVESDNSVLLDLPGHLFGDPDSNGLSTQTAGFGVNSVSGNFYHEEVDVAMPGIELPFAFSRAYNSIDIGVDQFQQRMPTPLGDGWTHAYHVLLRMNAAKNQAQLIWEDGRRDSFEKSGDQWQAVSAGNFSTLKASTNKDYAWEVLTTDKTRLFFDSSFHLRIIQAATEQKIQLSYQGDNLISVIDTAGRTVTFNYTEVNNEQRLQAVKLPLGRSIQFSYTQNGFLKAVTDMRGNTRRYVYFNGYLREIYPATVGEEDDGKPELTIRYDDKYRVVEQETAQTLSTEGSGKYNFVWDDTAKKMTYNDPTGQGATFQRNDHGQIIEVIPRNRPAGVKEVVSYQATTGPQSILTKTFADNQGQLTRFEYNDSNTPFEPTRIVPPKVDDNDSVDWQATYDNNHRLATIKDTRGLNATIVRDIYGNPESISETGAGIPQTLVAETRYFTGELNGQSNSITDRVDGEIKIVSRAKDGQPKETHEYIKGSEYLTTHYRYDNAGRVIETEDHRGTLTCFKYDANDNLIHWVKGLTGRCNFSAPASVSVRHDFFEYDKDNRIIKEVQAYGSDKPLETTYVYDVNTGLLSQTRFNNTYITRYEYDNDGRLFKQIDSSVGREDRYYELASGKVQITHENANASQNGGTRITRYERDENGRVKFVSSCAGIAQADVSSSDCTGEQVRSTLIYDNKGRVTSELAALVLNGTNPTTQRVTEYQYQDEGRTVIIKQRANIDDGASTEKKLQYDALGNLLTVTEYDDGKGIVARMEYDGESRLTKLIDPNGLTTVYTYDRVGRPTSRDDIRGKVIWRYNDIVGIVERIEPDGSKITDTYDRLGQHSQRTTSDKLTFSWQYNALGQVTKEIWDGQDFTGERNYSYNALAELEKVTDSFGQDVSYSYDNAGRMKTKSYAGISLTHRYNGLDQLIKMTSPAGDFDFSYQDFTEALASVTYPNGYQSSYQRNSLGELERLTSSRSGSALLDYQLTLNALGWRKQIDPAQQPVKPSYQNQLLNFTFTDQGLMKGINEKPVQYDKRGNVTSLPAPVAGSFTYDHLNRLTQEDDATFRYDAARNRLQAERGEQVTRYLLDVNRGLPDVIGTLNSNNELQDTFIHGPGGLLAAKSKDGSYRFAHADFNSNIVALTDASGGLNSAYAYSPFGRNAGLQGDANFPFRFAGGVGAMTDPEGGIYMRARHYHSGIGQFTSADLIPGSMLRTQSLNRYAYIEGKLLNTTDPSGLKPYKSGNLTYARFSNEQAIIFDNKNNTRRFISMNDLSVDIRDRLNDVSISAPRSNKKYEHYGGDLTFNSKRMTKFVNHVRDNDPGLDNRAITFAWQNRYKGDEIEPVKHTATGLKATTMAFGEKLLSTFYSRIGMALDPVVLGTNKNNIESSYKNYKIDNAASTAKGYLDLYKKNYSKEYINYKSYQKNRNKYSERKWVMPDYDTMIHVERMYREVK